MKLIFLDVDGVLACNGSGYIETEKLEFLTQIVEEVGASCVISSNWRVFPELREELLEALATYSIPCIGCTPIQVRDSRARPMEILEFLSRQEEPVDAFVAIDDRCLLDECGGSALRQHFVKTEYAVGLCEQIVQEVIACFQLQSATSGDVPTTQSPRSRLQAAIERILYILRVPVTPEQMCPREASNARDKAGRTQTAGRVCKSDSSPAVRSLEDAFRQQVSVEDTDPTSPTTRTSFYAAAQVKAPSSCSGLTNLELPTSECCSEGALYTPTTEEACAPPWPTSDGGAPAKSTTIAPPSDGGAPARSNTSMLLRYLTWLLSRPLKPRHATNVEATMEAPGSVKEESVERKSSCVDLLASLW